MRLFFAVVVGGLGALAAREAGADVFNLTHFVTPGEFALGVEPVLTMTDGAGLGFNARYTQGLTELLNVSGLVGTGTGPRQFRAGADATFDFFPDLDRQPGLGLATRALYVQVPSTAPALPGAGSLSGQLELTAIPYIHKTFASGATTVDPFFSFPVGVSLFNGQPQALATAVIGTEVKGSEHLWYSAEFGIAVDNTESYFSGGIAYYH